MSIEKMHWIENEETAKQRVEQAKKLKEQVKKGASLRFEAFLTSRQAEWVLDMVEKGDFLDPSEAIFVFMQQAQELDEHDDLKLELLKKSIDEGLADVEAGRTVPLEDAFRKIEEKAQNRPKPVVWEKIKQPDTEEA